MMKLKICIKNLMESRGRIISIKRPIFLFVIVFLTFVYLIHAQQPSLHTVQGYIFHTDSSQAPTGTKARINASTTTVLTQTSGPPGSTGFYSSSINALDGENVTITAFNSTSWGRNTTSILASSSTTRMNITLISARPSERDINITTVNNSLYDKFKIFNITFNVTALGGANSINCNATIAINDQNVINVTGNKTKTISNVVLGSTNNEFFEVKALNAGAATINITSLCTSDGENFEGLNIDYLTLRVANQPPQLHTVQGYIFNIDNVTQAPSGTNVTINATQTGSFVSITTSGPPGHTGFYSATINAIDGETIIIRAYNATYDGTANASLLNAPSVTRANISLETPIINAPTLSNILVDDEFSSPSNEIDLTVAGAKTVNCTANASDPDGFSNIANVTAIFFDTNNASLNSEDDNNNHYTNNSCSLSNCVGLTCQATCSFNVWYYANANSSQSWICNMTATDYSNNKAYATDNVSINTLLALEFNDVNFGTIGPGRVSNESISNITNEGNVKIDISLYGFGNLSGDGNAMNCNNGKNISIGNEKYNLTASNPGELTLNLFESYYKNLTNSSLNEIGFNLDFRRDDAFNEATKPTYWRIYLPPSLNLPVNASCIGKINIAAMVDT